MNGKELFDAMGGIDEELVAAAQGKEKDYKMKNIITKKLLPLAACLALIVTAGLGFGLAKRGDPALPSSAAPVPGGFGLLVASAAEDGSYDYLPENKEWALSMPYNAGFTALRTAGLSPEERNKEFEKLACLRGKDTAVPGHSRSSVVSYDSNDPDTARVIYSVVTDDYFSFSVDNAEKLDKIVISGDERDYMLCSRGCVTAGAEGKELIISGDEYRADSTVGFGWTPSFELLSKFADDPAMTLSDASDKLTVTAYYTDGTSESFGIDISFDADGTMTAKIVK